MALRFDTLKFDAKATKTSIGIKVDAHIARTGILEYQQSDGSTIREYRSPTEVFAEDSIDSFRGIPVTDLHPGLLDGRSYSRHQRGHCSDDVARSDDGAHLSARLYINDSDLVKAVFDGTRHDLSCGYTCDIDATAGVTETGERYDQSQTNIRGNHIAFLPPGHGRSGDTVAVRLDSNGDAFFANNEEPINMENEEKTLANGKLLAAEIARQDAVTRAEIATARADELEKELVQLRADLAEETSPKRIDEAVAARMALLEKAKTIRADGVYEGKTARDVMVEALGTDFPKASDDFILGAFEARASIRSDAARADSDAVNAVANGPVTTRKTRMMELQDRVRLDVENAWKGN